ncbi:MAG TPA: hypothetical protein VIU93_13960 [Gallionellaceae bacterium]
MAKSNTSLFSYTPEQMEGFHSYIYEWIDNLQFLVSPSALLGERATSYVEAAKVVFGEMDWKGDGEIQVLWLPLFVFSDTKDISTEGVVIWHVKQIEDGISYLLSPVPLQFKGLL